MARKIGFSSATLTVKLTESLTIDGRDYGGVSSWTHSGISNITRRLETITSTEATIVSFGAAIGAGTYIPAEVKYMRFSNLDDTNFITLTFANEDDDEVAIKLDYGQSFIWNGDLSGGVVDTMDANSGGAASSGQLADITKVSVQADSGTVDLQIFVASV